MKYIKMSLEENAKIMQNHPFFKGKTQLRKLA